jgi:hypothetical protein
MISSMSTALWIGAATLAIAIVGAWLSRRVLRAGAAPNDLGTISPQWIAEQRMHGPDADR